MTARSNVFVERLWRTIKYEEIYLKAYDSVAEARQCIGCFIDWYNHCRPHSSVESSRRWRPIKRCCQRLNWRRERCAMSCPPRGRSSEGTTAAVDNSPPLPTVDDSLISEVQLSKQARPPLSIADQETWSYNPL